MLAVGLAAARVVRPWSAACIIIGCAMILVFMDLDNWMLIGATLMLVGLAPVSRAALESSADSPTEPGCASE